jgi:tRNA(fMet)-specific endonuclease VapC
MLLVGTALKFEQIVLDTSVAVDLLRADRDDPPPVSQARELLLPLFALAELQHGALMSRRVPENLHSIEALVRKCRVLLPETETASHYAQVRKSWEARHLPPSSSGKFEGLRHDLWIAALCLQHKLPLLSNDRDFDGIEGLEVIHW